MTKPKVRGYHQLLPDTAGTDPPHRGPRGWARCDRVHFSFGFEAGDGRRVSAVVGLEVKVPLVEPFTRPVPRDVAQDVMDAALAWMDPDERAQRLALLRESTVA